MPAFPYYAFTKLSDDGGGAHQGDCLRFDTGDPAFTLQFDLYLSHY
jgi:hypothetical protein